VRATSHARVGGRAEVSVRGRLVCTSSRRGGLYKTFFYFESLVHESIVLSFLPPTCTAHTVTMLLHDC